jgi:hypothetical protein
MAYVSRYPNYYHPSESSYSRRPENTLPRRPPPLLRKRVTFGPVSVRTIPNRFDALAQASEPRQESHMVRPTHPQNQITPMISPIYGRKVGTVGMTSGLMIIGDPEEFYEYFKQFPTWEECLASLTPENYQWTGAPNTSGLIIRDSEPRANPFRLYIKSKPNLDTHEIHLF